MSQYSATLSAKMFISEFNTALCKSLMHMRAKGLDSGGKQT